MTRYPNLYILGAPKCGTTAMADYLRPHPGIYAPLQKEFMYFGDDYPRARPGITLEKYMSYFADWRDETYAVDASPLYMYSSTARAQIREASADARFILMVRNPTDMAFSWYHQLLYTGSEAAETFEEALEVEDRRVAEGYVPPNKDTPLIARYTYLCKVSPHVEACFREFGRENVHVIVFDDLRDRTQSAYLETLAFLGLPEHIPEDLTPRNSRKRYRLKAVQDFTRAPPKILGHILDPFVSRDVRWKVRDFIRRLNSVPESGQAIRPETREKLDRLFAEDVERLSGLLGRDLTGWSTGRAASSRLQPA